MQGKGVVNQLFGQDCFRTPALLIKACTIIFKALLRLPTPSLATATTICEQHESTTPPPSTTTTKTTSMMRKKKAKPNSTSSLVKKTTSRSPPTTSAALALTAAFALPNETRRWRWN